MAKEVVSRVTQRVRNLNAGQHQEQQGPHQQVRQGDEVRGDEVRGLEQEIEEQPAAGSNLSSERYTHLL